MDDEECEILKDSAATTTNMEDEPHYTQAFVWPSHNLEIRMERDSCPGGKILLVMEDLQYILEEAQQVHYASAQIKLMYLKDESGATLAARARETLVDYLRPRVPEYAAENVGVERRLKGAPVTYVRSSYGNLLSTELGDGQIYSMPVRGVDPALKIHLRFKTRYDVAEAALEAKTVMSERAKAREQQDAATKDRKIKVYCSGGFELSTSPLAVQSQIHQSMRSFNAKTGGKEDLWPDGAITHIEAGKDKKRNERCFFLITSTKAQAEMLLAATNNKLTPPSLLLNFHSRALQMHTCKLRTEEGRGGAANTTAPLHPATMIRRRQPHTKLGATTPKPAAALSAVGIGTTPVPARSSQSCPWTRRVGKAKNDTDTPSRQGKVAAASELTMTDETVDRPDTHAGMATEQADVLCVELLARIEALEKEKKELQRDNKELRALHKKEQKKGGERNNSVKGQQTLSDADVKVLSTTVQTMVMESLNNNSILKAMAGLKTRMEQMEDRQQRQEELARQEKLAQEEFARQEELPRQAEHALAGTTVAASPMEGSNASSVMTVYSGHSANDHHYAAEAGRKRQKHSPPQSPTPSGTGTEAALMDTGEGVADGREASDGTITLYNPPASPAHPMGAPTQTSLPQQTAGSGGDVNH
jgi:hypothetical protein